MLCLTDWIQGEQFKLDIGWSMCIILATHIALVYLWMILQCLRMIWLMYLRILGRWKVWAVRAFGWRIGTDYKDKFSVNLKEGRTVEQMMDLKYNAKRKNIMVDLKAQLATADDDASKK